MLISVATLTRYFGVRPVGVLHVGAHEAEESEAYCSYNWGPVTWIEMQPEKFERLKARFANDPYNRVLHAACWDDDGLAISFFQASNGQSSSLLAPLEHLTEHPHISFSRSGTMITSRLDSILPPDAKFDFISLDIQGAELRALRGMGERLREVKWAFLEVNTKPMYEGCALIDEMDAFMKEAGFVRLLTKMAGSHGWGDALYVNEKQFAQSKLRRLKLMARVWATQDIVRRLVRRPRLAIEWISQERATVHR